MSRQMVFVSIVTHILPNYMFLTLKSNYYHCKKAWRTWTEISGEMCVQQYHHCECETHTT